MELEFEILGVAFISVCVSMVIIQLCAWAILEFVSDGDVVGAPSPCRDEPIGRADASSACAVCRENFRKVAAMPCGHFSYCFGCSERIGATCSVCRADVREFARVFA